MEATRDPVAEREAIVERLRGLRDLAFAEAMGAPNGREHKAWADAAKTWVDLLAKVEGADDIAAVRRILDAAVGLS